MNKTTKHYDMTITVRDLPKPLHFYHITIQMFYALRRKYFDIYGNTVEDIEVLNNATKKRVEPLCYYCGDDDGEYTNPVKFYERYGW